MKNVCTYFGKCGGCQYQNLSDLDYETMKKNAIIKAFSFMRIPVKIDTFIRVPTGTRRRACFAFKKGALGFNQRKSHDIIDVDECLMLTKGLNALLPALKELVKKLGGKGDIWVLETPYGVDMHIKTANGRATLDELEMLAAFGNKNPVARMLFNGDPVLEKVKLAFPPDVFLQPSAEGEKMLVDLVKKQIKGDKKAVDLFCGTGTFTRPMMAMGIDAVGYDSEEESVRALGDKGIARDLFRNPLTADELAGFDVAVIDPPRAGAMAQTEQLATSGIKKIIMISCNPGTAARDAKKLCEAGYRVDTVMAIDQFTYSDHIEIIATFIKKD